MSNAFVGLKHCNFDAQGVSRQWAKLDMDKA